MKREHCFDRPIVKGINVRRELFIKSAVWLVFSLFTRTNEKIWARLSFSAALNKQDVLVQRRYHFSPSCVVGSDGTFSHVFPIKTSGKFLLQLKLSI